MIARRKLLLAGGAAAVAALAPPAWAQSGFPSHRWVNIVFSHTGERFHDRYFWDGAYSMTAVQQFSWTCRDYRKNEWKWMNPWLMDLLFVLHWKYNKEQIDIFSGYRTPQTNAKLEGAALNSQHLRANALDIHLQNIDNDAVARDFKTFLSGGVGMYPGRDFTHMDFGPARNWVG
jgi:uncharacterized protein YcbK (DUF882 family)